jgi:hypothetical protein
VLGPFLAWRPGSLALSNATLSLPSGFSLAVTNDATLVSGSSLIVTNPLATAVGGNLLVWNSQVLINSGTNAAVLSVANNLLVQDGGRLYVHSAPTNGPEGEYGALVDIGHDLIITSNAWAYVYSHPTNGGSVLFRCRHLTVSGGTNSAGICATGTGYAATTGDGYGPGFGRGGPYPNNPYGMGNGASHGGLGGRGGYNGTFGGIGATYGSSNAPVDPGSAGGGDGGVGGNGGGAVRLEVSGTITMNGLIVADGARSTDGPGRGSGGGIYIRCKIFAGGPGAVQANGGDAAGWIYSGGAGGGGRIAIWRVRDTSAGQITAEARGGSHYLGSGTGQDGTVIWGWLQDPGTLFMVR